MLTLPYLLGKRIYCTALRIDRSLIAPTKFEAMFTASIESISGAESR
jgi:hypothetical protein